MREVAAMSRHFSLVTGLKVFAVFDALVVAALAWLIVSSDLFS
jgi:hypothetical protein